MAVAQAINQRGLREKVNLNSLTVNIAHVFRLDGDGGVETPGTWGTAYRYAWDGNRISFVDPVVHELIQAQGARSGDSIKFWRLETRNGSRKGPIQYRIELVNTADGGDDGTGIPNDPIPPTAREARAQAATAKATPPAWVSEARALAQQAEPVATPAPLVSAPQTLPRVEQAAETITSVTVTDTQRREQATARETARLSAAAVAAIDAANTAESYAEAHGRRVAFTSEDLRAMTLSVYITLCGSQR
jgi:hypothetical protein